MLLFDPNVSDLRPNSPKGDGATPDRAVQVTPKEIVQPQRGVHNSTSESERERRGVMTAYLDTSLDLIRTIADVLDVRSVFPRLSQIANTMLPHDALALSFFDDGGQLILQARTSDLPELTPHAFRPQPSDALIVDDLRVDALPVARGVNPTARLVSVGYRSLLAVSTQARDQRLGVGFWSKQPNAFDTDDLPMARHIVEHIALAVSHERLARPAHEAPSERARTDRPDARTHRATIESDDHSRIRVVGRSPEWQYVLGQATRVAAKDTTVLITGESGTGKEVIARHIHRLGLREGGPFVALNCAALPEQLLESELFGYERGAFTSAHQSKPGQIELASGGVLFLDEVSEMSLTAQAKFLRVLQEREFQRLGGTKCVKADIRVVAATNRDLAKAVERGMFREDLYYRLQVFDIHIPALRERRSDILPLADCFLEELGASAPLPIGLTTEAREALVAHHWRGNVRELRNVLERAAIVSDGGVITLDNLALQPSRRPLGGMNTDLNAAERETIAQVLRECRGNKSKAAQRLGLTRTQLYVRLRKHQITDPLVPEEPPRA
jgi:transcriptional regulator with GAF, ATPase, and Fis domain